MPWHSITETCSRLSERLVVAQELSAMDSQGAQLRGGGALRRRCAEIADGGGTEDVRVENQMRKSKSIEPPELRQVNPIAPHPFR
eukprot:gene1946-biopygen5669